MRTILHFRDLWKEETKLASSTNYARDQLSAAQRNLASTMDKVRDSSTCSSLAALEALLNDIRSSLLI